MHPSFRMHINKDKDVATAHHNLITMSNVTRIYTDGSSIGGKVGAAAALYQPDQPPCTLCYHLGSLDNHMVFEAEAVGLILTAKLIHSTSEITLPINIFVDNQATIISSQRPKSKPGHYILEKLCRLLLGIYCNHNITHKDICVSWAPGHTGIIHR